MSLRKMPKRSGDGKDITMVKPWAIEITEKYSGGTPFHIGDRMIHKKHGLVEIISGRYWGTYGISNFWDWKKVLPDGSLGDKIYSGYGRNDIFIFSTIKRK